VTNALEAYCVMPKSHDQVSMEYTAAQLLLRRVRKRPGNTSLGRVAALSWGAV